MADYYKSLLKNLLPNQSSEVPIMLDQDLFDPQMIQAQVPVPMQKPMAPKKISPRQPAGTQLPGAINQPDFAQNDLSQQMIEQFQQAIQDRRARLDGLNEQYQNAPQAPQGIAAADLSPLMGMVDAWTGSKMAGSYKAPSIQDSKEAQLSQKLQMAINKEQGGLVDDQYNLARLVVEDDRVRDSRLIGSQDKELDRTLKAALLGQTLAAQKDMNDARIDGRKDAAANKPDKMTGDTWKAAGFAKRIDQAEQVWDHLAGRGYTGPSRSEVVSGMLPSEMQGDDYKSYDQAARNFINATLRRESGAAISPGEFASAKAQYLPQPGDTPEQKAQKRANRQQVRESLKAEGGQAYNRIPSIPGLGKEASSPTNGKVKVRFEDKVMMIDEKDLASAKADGAEEL